MQLAASTPRLVLIIMRTFFTTYAAFQTGFLALARQVGILVSFLVVCLFWLCCSGFQLGFTAVSRAFSGRKPLQYGAAV